MALRVLCNIRMREIVQIHLMSLKKCASDSSAYVRKTAAHSCGKIYQIDPDSKGEIVDVIEKLLGDKNTQVLSSAVAAFTEVCPDDLDLLHPHYRKICHLLADLDDWGQITTLNLLTRYIRKNFVKPEVVVKEEKKEEGDKKKKQKGGKGKGGKGKGRKRDFYASDNSDSDSDSDSDSSSDSGSEEEEEDADVSGLPKLPEDHALALRVSLPLLRSRNSGVVLAVAGLHHYCGGGDKLTMSKIGRGLVRIMRNYREIQYITLTNISVFAKEAPDMFRKYLKDFFVAESEPTFVRRMKVDVLAALVCTDNSVLILREFTRYVKDDDKDFVRHAIQAIVRIANTLPEIADRCLRGLMGLVSTDNNEVVAEAVVAIRQLVQQHPQHDGPIVRLAKKLDKIASPSARAAIVWILGEFQSKPRVAAMAPDALRLLAKNFRNESGEVKAQVVTLAAKTALWQPDSTPVQLLLKFVLELARYDSDFDLRDRSRLLRYLLLSGSEITALDATAFEESGAVIAVKKTDDDGDALAAEAADAAAAEAAAADGSGEGAAASADGAAGGSGSAGSSSPSKSKEGVGAAAPAAPAATLHDRMKAVLLATKPPPAITAAMESSGSAAFAMGSLSFIVGHSARGYQAVPAWATEMSATKLREPPKEDDGKGKSKKKPAKAESSDDDSDSSDSSSDSDSDSDSGSDSESAASSEDESEKASEKSDGDDEDEDDDGSDDDKSESDASSSESDDDSD